MNLTLRPERADDHRKVEELTREAFWGFMRPTCDEHYLVHLLRKSPAFLPELDLVAESDGKIVGNVMYTKAKIVDSAGGEHEVITFGPLSVLPEYQRRGVGSALMRFSILRAKQFGYRAIVFYGHPDYYPRFGFRNSETFHITGADGGNFDALMAMPLYEGALDGVSGSFFEDSVFDMNPEEAEAYDRNFPHKDPASMQPIDVLLEKLEPPARKEFTNRDITSLASLNCYSGREMLRWGGIDERAFEVINQTLKEYNFAEKLAPSSEILKRADLGIKALTDK